MPFVSISPTKLYALGRGTSSNSFPRQTARGSGSAILSIRKHRKSSAMGSTHLDAERDKVLSIEPPSKMVNVSCRNGLENPCLTPAGVTVDEVETSQQDLINAAIQNDNGIAPLNSNLNGHASFLLENLRPIQQSLPSEKRSELQSSTEEDVQPIFGRASSVRVSRPQIIDSTQQKGKKLRHETCWHLDDQRMVIQEEGDHLGYGSESLPSMPEEVKARPLSDNVYDDIPESNSAQEPNESPRNIQYSAVTPRHLPTQQEQTITREVSFVDDQSPPTGNTLHSIHPSIVCSDTTSKLKDSLLQYNDIAPIQGINRAVSMPLSLPSSSLSRRVMIRPSDLVVRSYDEPKFFRESIVTTPYPGRSSADAGSVTFSQSCDKPGVNTQGDKKSNGKNRAKTEGKRGVSFSNALALETMPKSPESPELLFLDLNLFKHPCARTMIEVQVTDKGTFDDEVLFQQIRNAYSRQLLCKLRVPLLLVRRVSHVSITASPNTSSADFNSIDFLKHFRNPQLGHKRKAWCIWLRKRNQHAPSQVSAFVSTPVGPPLAHVRKIDNLKRLSLRTRGLGFDHSRQNSKHQQASGPQDLETNNNKRFSTASDASSFHFVYSPAVPRLPFFSTKPESSSPTDSNAADKTDIERSATSPCRSFFWPNDLSASLSKLSKVGNPDTNPRNADADADADAEAVKIVTIALHHEFRLGTLALLTLLVVLQGILASAIWVVFGTPGTRPGMDWRSGGAGDWRVDAQQRVVTGVVIGLAVLLVGFVLEAMLVWGSWLLL